ncbi:MAG: hypothetical protein IJT36_03445 [Alphaproteobacteria bacterium]|nr:hypothetical protein [Alphaproteobacteria bacterium]
MKTKNLRVRITQAIPVDERIRPRLGKCYDVLQETKVNGLSAYVIRVNGMETTIYKFECKEIDENGNDII